MIDFRITEGLAYYIGERIVTNNHAHHALEFIFSIDKPFNLLTNTCLFENFYSFTDLPKKNRSIVNYKLPQKL